MQFTTALLAAASLASGVFAAPAPAEAAVVSMSAGAQWTIVSLSHPCNSNDSQCTWQFGINTNDGSAITPCRIVVNAAGGQPASRTNFQDARCGRFRINGGWSGQFGPGFTTIPVVDDAAHLIAYPAYEDSVLVGGAVVRPDRSYNVERVPGF